MSTRSLFLPFLFLIAGALCGTLAACGGGGLSLIHI